MSTYCRRRIADMQNMHPKAVLRKPLKLCMVQRFVELGKFPDFYLKPKMYEILISRLKVLEAEEPNNDDRKAKRMRRDD
jgi:hypothetical protein